MRRVFASSGAVVLSVLVAGCAAEPVDSPPPDEAVGTAASPQIGPLKGYTIQQAGVTVAAAWRGTITSGADVEYWVALPSYSASAARTFSATSESCATWKRTVCSSDWSGASYYQGVFTETTLSCFFPPGPCSAPRGAHTFLGAGSYQTDDAFGSPFAWTLAQGSCEYWAMDHTISGTSTQSPLSPGYSSLSAFESAMCAMGTLPSTWFSVYYENLSNFCSADDC